MKKKNEFKTGRYCGFHIIPNPVKKGKTIHIVFLKYVPVVQFDPDSVPERRLAVIKQNNQDSQMEFDFTWDKEIREKIEESSSENPPQSKQQSKQNLIERLQTGERNNFAGGLMHLWI